MRPPGERIMPGGRGREGLGLVRVFAGGVLAFLSGRDQPRRPGDEGKGGSQPYLGPRGVWGLPRRQDD
jgi:hypothetical protein